MSEQPGKRPNIIICLVDDLGFSDLGSYGSRLLTHNIDRLAENGIRCTQMYNSARCCPSRAALLTGLNPHQAGVGHMTADYGIDSYQGYLNDRCVTIAEVLRTAGYRTLMSGKWHVGGNYHPPVPEIGWPTGEEGYPTPRQRGFDRFFGIWGGYTSFFNPDSLGLDDTPNKAETPDFYLTEEITNHALQMIDEGSDSDNPFFLYLSYTAPHWPLHALEEDVAKYEGAFRQGWDSERTARHESQKGMGLLDEKWLISARDQDAPDWNDVQHQDWEDLRMAVYAAQVDRVDQGVGRIMDRLRETGEYDNTL
ncbi:MAG: sulfatase-like hydrolase/transferase, partial [Dehalococcoidia bacterium]|nr:sulfatase-like hydrolase/transferase [Dehalococcoidia bacterium]